MLWPDTERVMGWDVGASGFKVVLSADVPKIVGTHLAPAVDAFLADHGLTRSDISRWVCHPGGPKVIDAMETSLELPEGALAETSRTELHRAMVERARAVGVRWLHEAVTSVETLADRVRVAGIEARWLVAADGLRSPIRRMLGLELPARGARRYGGRRHDRMAPWSDRVEVWFAEGAEAFVTPVTRDPALLPVARRPSLHRGLVAAARLMPFAFDGVLGMLDVDDVPPRLVVHCPA